MLCVEINTGYLKVTQIVPDATCAYVVMPYAEYEANSFDSDSFADAFGGTLSVWAVGVGVGLLINILRRLKA